MNNIKAIGDLANYMIHPELILKGLWYYTTITSFWICLLTAMLCSMFYCFGFKKLAKYVPASFVIYTLIRALSSVF